MDILKSKRCYNAKPSAYYLYVKTKISLDFYICISVTLKSGSHLFKNICYLLQLKPFENNEKCFLFHLKTSFRSYDI